ncbi:MAG: response regulator [Calditrichaeota bacterium]|nr:response regulator [Candidatus Cloacimonadota bacterium]MCB1045620.1 response regulator [Calditrichota bacterium]MCB9472867.1 response regulator [Candidatus Delongbacteria bacterium]
MRFLVVEDDFIARRILTQHLSRWGSCDVAVDGAEAVQAVKMALVEAKPYDLICLDIMMPNLNGQEALKRIRAVEVEFEISPGEGSKIVMTTAMGDSRNVLSAFDSQCEGYLVKPITPEALEKQLICLDLIPA